MTIESLCIKYRNEDPHTEQVTRLALAIFDRVSKPLGLAQRLRRLLSAAAGLHDIGYSISQLRHADAGAELIFKKGVTGYSKQDVSLIANIIRLHQGRDKKACRADTPMPSVALECCQLAAILRVADGLDHSHLQDTRILSLQYGKHGIRLRVRTLYPGNVTHALSKSDLWKKIFPASISIMAEKHPVNGPLYGGILRKEDTALEAARRLFYAQFRIMVDALDSIRDNRMNNPVHDLRVGLRRFRALLKVFRSRLKKTSARRIDRFLSALSDKLGPVRDNDVWVQAFARAMAHPLFRSHAASRKYLLQLQKQQERDYREIQALLESSWFFNNMGQTLFFLRIEMPDLIRNDPHAPGVARTLAKKTASIYGKMLKYPCPSFRSSPKEIHRLRKLCRKVRYRAEFAGPVCGKEMLALAQMAVLASTALGRLNDVHVQLKRLKQGPRKVRTALKDILRKKKKACIRDFNHAWKRMPGEKFRQRLLKRADLAKAKK